MMHLPSHDPGPASDIKDAVARMGRGARHQTAAQGPQLVGTSVRS